MATAAPGGTLLRMRGIQKRFGAVQALAGVDLDVAAGEVHALVGENGAGKSTLMKVLAGAHRPDRGAMTLDGIAYAPSGPLDARGVAMIYQELALAPDLSVEENVVLGREPAHWGVVDRGSRREAVRRVLEWIDEPALAPDRRVGDLAPGPRQLVEIARALITDARLVVMDEPTSSLSRRETSRLFAIVGRLRARGVSIIYISHFLEEVAEVAQRYTVIRDGRSVESGTVVPGAAFVAHVIGAMTGGSLEDAYPHIPHEPGDVVLEIDRVSGVRLPDAVTLALRRGEIVGIAGLIGAGRTELLRAIYGLAAVRDGRIRVAPHPWDRGEAPRRRLAQGMGLLSEDRAGEGLALGMSIADNLTLSRPLATAGVVSRAAQRDRTRELAARLNLRYQDADHPAGDLSGGNQQKVAIARLLHHDVEVLLFDEPTRGVDVSTRAEIYRLMGELASRGRAILFVSSYLPELLGVCDRIGVMSRGRITQLRAASDWSETTLLEAATAVEYA